MPVQKILANALPDAYTVGTRAMDKIIQNIDIPAVVNRFNRIGVDAYFGSNPQPALAAGCAFTADMFLQMGLKPPTSVYAVSGKKLRGLVRSDVLGFCLPDTSSLTKGCTVLEDIFQRKFAPRSVFINSDYKWKVADFNTGFSYFMRFHSTPHFLHTFIHEFSHNAHIDHIYRTYGYHSPNNFGYRVGDGSLFWSKLNDSAALGQFTGEIRKEVSRYATTNPAEMVAENMTELIVKSMDPFSLRLTKNPFVNSAAVNGKTVDDIFCRAWAGILPGKVAR